MTVDQAMLDELKAIRQELAAMRRQTTASTRSLLSRTEAARMLGIDRHRLGRLMKAGLIRATQDGGRLRIAREEVDRVARDGIPREPGRVGRPRKPLHDVSAAIRALPLPRHPTAGS